MSSPPGENNNLPPSNPILTAYLTFVQDTPLVTRYVITTLFLTYLASWFVDPTYALGNRPFFSIFQFELYRLVFSPLLCNNLLSLIFAYLAFVDHGKRLEFSMGSSAFAVLIGTLGVGTNVLFCIITIVLYGLSGNVGYLHMNSESIWIVLLALIAVECSNAPEGSKRRLFVVEVPTYYYPLAILLLFTLLGGGPQLHFFLSVGVGYSYGKGRLDKFKVNSSRVSRWESNEGCLSNFTRRQGWVVGHMATGSSAWSQEGSSGSGGGSGDGGGWQPTSFVRGQRTDASSSEGGGASGGTVAAPPAGGWGARSAGSGGGGDDGATTGEKPSFPKGKGVTLGGGSTGGGGLLRGVRGGGGNAGGGDARRAMLDAAERRAAAAGGGGSGSGREEV